MTNKLNNTENRSSSDHYTYWLAVILPLTMILVSFLSGSWSWGLMDDTTLVNLPGNIWQRTAEILSTLQNSGRFQPIYAIQSAFFYKIFANNPGYFYIFRWFEVVFALGIWAWFCYRLTGEKTAAPLFFTVVLSFYKTYDAFFYLSIQEITGVLFAGLACILIFTATNRAGILFGLLFLLTALGTKETFIASGIAIAITLIIVNFNKPERKTFLWLGSVLLIGISAFGIFIKYFISKSYSAAYSLTDVGRITSNITLWFQKPFLFHLPWIILTAILLFMLRTKKDNDQHLQRLGLYLGIALYISYWLIILPWSTWGHYALPLGVFFAFLISVLIAERINRLNNGLRNTILIAAMFFTAFVSWAALRDQFTYQIDTASLIEWLAENPIFEHEVLSGAVVRGNASEACDAIPVKVRMLYNIKYPPFVFTSSIREILADPQTRYYLWGRYWGDQDLRRLGHDLWAPMFVSENWILFRRMY